MEKQETENGDQKTTSLPGRRWRQADAESGLAAWEESGLSLSGFAAKQGVDVRVPRDGQLLLWRNLNCADGALGHVSRQAALIG